MADKTEVKQRRDELYRQRYEAVRAWIVKTRFRRACFTFVYKILPYFVFAGYAALLGVLFIRRDERLLRCIAVPLFMFATLSAARRLLDRPRPYERFDITPIFPKNKKGQSFPSRHTASAAVIAMAFLYVSVPLGAAYTVIALLIAASRAAGGVHFPRDVAAGFIYAVICGAALFIL